MLNYNIASRAAQSNSVYVSVLQISIVHSDCASKSLCQKFFSRERPLLAWGKIFRYFATIMDRNRDSTHQSQRQFATFSGSWARVLKWGRKREKQRKGRLGIGAITIRFIVRGWNAILTERHSGKTKQVTNFKGKFKFFRFEIVKYETRAFKRKIEIKPIPILFISRTAIVDLYSRRILWKIPPAML